MKKVLLVLFILLSVSLAYAKEELRLPDGNFTVPDFNLNKRSIEPGDQIWFNHYDDYDNSWFDNNGFLFPHILHQINEKMDIGQVEEINKENVIIRGMLFPYSDFFFELDHVQFIPQQSVILIEPYRENIEINYFRTELKKGDIVYVNTSDGIYGGEMYDNNGYLPPHLFKWLSIARVVWAGKDQAKVHLLRSGWSFQRGVIQFIPQQGIILFNW